MENTITQLNISHIDIEDLFGTYTYSIPMDSMDISKLLILYGNNGAGKTTILQMIFNLLSSEDNKGHKSELANTKFRKIAITLSNGYIVSAYRTDSLLGAYYLSLVQDNNDTKEVFCKTIKEDGRFVIRDGLDGSDDVDLFLATLSSINLSIHYLADDRKIKNYMSMIVDEKSDKVSISRLPIELLRKMERGNLEESFSLSDIFLEVAVNRVESWFRQQSITANSIGQDSINLIYIELIEKLLENEEEILEIDNPKNSKEVILDALAKLKNRNKQFIEYKLTRNLNLDQLINIINKTSDSKIKLIENTLTPYIEGLNNKLNAIEKTKNIIEVFVTTLNDFYHGKKITFNIEDGLKIVSQYNDNEPLAITMLSSGEKQLLLLFCNIITVREQASIFIIDEPELSLNVVWQRKLVNALLAFSEGSSIQLILASHSIELLTQYDENVCDLTNIKEF